jgi:hypothetical protein
MKSYNEEEIKESMLTNHNQHNKGEGAKLSLCEIDYDTYIIDK